jgi:hypothetical protein
VDADARRAKRTRTIKEAYILWGEMRHPKGCVLLDLSETGARLCVFGVNELPQTLTVLVPRLGIRARVRVAWQRGRECGLEFLEGR